MRSKKNEFELGQIKCISSLVDEASRVFLHVTFVGRTPERIQGVAGPRPRTRPGKTSGETPRTKGGASMILRALLDFFTEWAGLLLCAFGHDPVAHYHGVDERGRRRKFRAKFLRFDGFKCFRCGQTLHQEEVYALIPKKKHHG